MVFFKPMVILYTMWDADLLYTIIFNHNLDVHELIRHLRLDLPYPIKFNYSANLHYPAIFPYPVILK